MEKPANLTDLSNTPENFAIFKSVIEQDHLVFITYDIVARQLMYVSPSYERVWERPVADVTAQGAGLIDTIHPEDRAVVAQAYRELVSGTVQRDVESRILLPDGAERWLLAKAFLTTHPDGRQFIAGFIQDITRTKETTRYLQKYAAQKNSVLEILSHDLAGPLATIQGLIGVIKRAASPYNNPTINELIPLILETCQRNLNLIRELVDQEFLESVNSALKKERVNVVDKVQEMLAYYRKTAESLSKQYTFQSSAPSIMLAIDDSKFRQVLNNLISNAIKFTRDNGTIAIGIEEKADRVLFTVADDGVGIPADLQSVLFDKFTKARRPGLRGEPSVGLGMSIIKTIVEWHNGTIRFESVEDQGTTFYIDIPKTHASTQEA